MLQVFSNRTKPAVGLDRSSRDTSADAASSGTDQSNDAALRLERELAVLLARKPKHRESSPGADLDPHDDEASLLPADEQGQSGVLESHEPDAAETSDSEVAQTETGATTSDAPVEMRVAETRNRWMKSTQRSRRSSMFRKTASVAITFAVTTFIISVVAVILFGMPNGFKKLIALNDRTAAMTSKAVPTMAVDRATGRMRWVSN